jgi:hypothetical protein
MAQKNNKENKNLATKPANKEATSTDNRRRRGRGKASNKRHNEKRTSFSYGSGRITKALFTFGKTAIVKRKNNTPEKPHHPPEFYKDGLPSPIRHLPLTCFICGKTIDEPLMAIGAKEGGEATHFDCVLSQLASREQLADNEKIIYLGGGSFGVVVFTNTNLDTINKSEERETKAQLSFEIKRKIDYERLSNLLVNIWRKDYAVTPTLVVAANKSTKD